jgi:hypothetical protein
MAIEEIEKRIEELKKEIEYEKEKMKCCGYGESDLMYLYGLEEELEDLENQLEEMEE